MRHGSGEACWVMMIQVEKVIGFVRTKTAYHGSTVVRITGRCITVGGVEQ